MSVLLEFPIERGWIYNKRLLARVQYLAWDYSGLRRNLESYIAAQVEHAFRDLAGELEHKEIKREVFRIIRHYRGGSKGVLTPVTEGFADPIEDGRIV